MKLQYRHFASISSRKDGRTETPHLDLQNLPRLGGAHLSSEELGRCGLAASSIVHTQPPRNLPSASHPILIHSKVLNAATTRDTFFHAYSNHSQPSFQEVSTPSPVRELEKLSKSFRLLATRPTAACAENHHATHVMDSVAAGFCTISRAFSSISNLSKLLRHRHTRESLLDI